MRDIVYCPICHEPYRVYSMMVGDQSRCPGCLAEEQERLHRREERDGMRKPKTVEDVLDMVWKKINRA